LRAAEQLSRSGRCGEYRQVRPGDPSSARGRGAIRRGHRGCLRAV